MEKEKTTSDEGLLAKLKKLDEEPESTEANPKLKKLMDKMMEPPPEPQLSKLWIFGDGLEKFHESLGDKQFKKLVESGRIVTDTEGMDYINSLNL